MQDVTPHVGDGGKNQIGVAIAKLIDDGFKADNLAERNAEPQGIFDFFAKNPGFDFGLFADFGLQISTRQFGGPPRNPDQGNAKRDRAEQQQNPDRALGEKAASDIAAMRGCGGIGFGFRIGRGGHFRGSAGVFDVRSVRSFCVSWGN